MWLEETSNAIAVSDSLDEETARQIALEWLEYEPQTLSGGLPGGNSPEAIACRARIKELNDTYSDDGWTFTTLQYSNSSIVPNIIYATAEQYGSPNEYTIVGINTNPTTEKAGPLLTTEWDQVDGFNSLCPNNSEAGCVSVAMAQIMNYHKSPAKFDWANMDDHNPTYAVQFLIADIGSTIGADYNNGGVANIIQAESGFKKYGYAASRKKHNETDVHIEVCSWGRPVFMSGVKESNGIGHAWVCDGSERVQRITKICAEFWYQDSYNDLGYYTTENPYVCNDLSITSSMLHMNWGWGGYRNGWFNDQLPSNVQYTGNRQNLYVNVK